MGSLSSASGSTSGTGALVAGAVIGRVPIFESTATNLLLQSAALGTAPWVQSGTIAVVNNSTLAPNGVVEADTLNDNGGTLGQVQQDVVIANDGATYTHSVYILAGTSLQCRVGLKLQGGIAVDNSVDINPVSGVIVTQSGAAAASIETIIIAGAVWFRVSIPATNNTSGNVTARAYVNPASSSLGAVGTVFAWGAQLETGTIPSSQIPTLTAQATRSAGILPLSQLETNGDFRSVQIITATGTYTPPVGLKRARVRLVAGGGASGGVATTAPGQSTAAAGGASGGYSEDVFTAAQIGASQAVTIGAGGTIGAVGANPGNTGGTTSFGALLTATGGPGGTGAANAGGINFVPGSASGTGTLYGQTISQQPSGPGISSGTPALIAVGGNGGSNPLGGGAVGLTTAGVTSGVAGKNFGGGASGAAISQSQNNVAGSPGAPGVIVVEEFF